MHLHIDVGQIFPKPQIHKQWPSNWKSLYHIGESAVLRTARTTNDLWSTFGNCKHFMVRGLNVKTFLVKVYVFLVKGTLERRIMTFYNPLSQCRKWLQMFLIFCLMYMYFLWTCPFDPAYRIWFWFIRF